jgi:hypothetical protein
MNTQIRLTRGSALTLALAFIAVAVGFRLLRATSLPDLPNFSPVMAIALCGALVLPGSLALLVPLVALIGSDMLLNLHYGVAILSSGDLLRDACYGLGVAAGLGLRRMNAGVPAILAAVIANALLFYVVTNTASWLGNPAYAQSLGGWLQALTVGVPGFPPTWTFFRNSLASDLLFTSTFLVALRLAIREPRAIAAHA